jgi:hypothetical protein
LSVVGPSLKAFLFEAQDGSSPFSTILSVVVFTCHRTLDDQPEPQCLSAVPPSQLRHSIPRRTQRRMGCTNVIPAKLGTYGLYCV